MATTTRRAPRKKASPAKPAPAPRPAATLAEPSYPNTPAANLLQPDALDGDPGFLSKDEVFDDTDLAQHMQLREQAACAARARELARPQQHPDFDGEHCIDCDDAIPEPRLRLGRIRCVDCQTEVEKEESRARR